MSADREELRRLVRNDPPPPDAAVVIRGGPDTLSLLRSHARRLNRLYELDGAAIFGVSVFVATEATGSTSEQAILRRKLGSYPTVYRTTVARLTEIGFRLLPTFTSPHYTVLLPDLDTVDDLAAAFGDLQPNPYAVEREETP